MRRRIKDWIRPISQMVLLLALIVIGIIFDVAKGLANIIQTVGYKDDELPDAIRIASAYGRLPLTIAVVIIVLLWIRKANQEAVLNPDNNIYHDHRFLNYWICRHLLGYKTCRLKLVPVPMQFKLVVNGIFPNFITDEGIHSAPDDDKVTVNKPNNGKYTGIVNLLISDTYKVRQDQLPQNVNTHSLVEIDRSSDNHTRYDSEKLVSSVISTVRNLPQNVETIDIFATTNPVNTYRIAKEAFSTGGRDNIEHLYVFPQENSGNRNFETKGIKIY